MIIQLNWKKGVQILQPYTSSEELIKKAVARAAGFVWVDNSLDALKMAQEIGVEAAGGQAQAKGYIGETELRQALEKESIYFKKGRFEKTIGGILAVFNMIKDLSGRKSILLISDGIPDAPIHGLIRVFDPFNLLRKKNILRGEEVLRELINLANVQNISIYTLDPGTFTDYFFTASAESDKDSAVTMTKKADKLAQVQTLRWISEDTGAAWLRGGKKYDVFREVMSVDLNYYYQLSYYPPRKEADNRYHKIEVKVDRRSVDVRYRGGYTDYSEDQKERILMVTAYYNPSRYKDLPFEAEFIPFHTNSNKYQPWINIALPVSQLFTEKGATQGQKRFDLHIWIKDKKREDKCYGGEIPIRFNIDSSFLKHIKQFDYLCYHFLGPELNFPEREYQAIFALFDSLTNEVGTWESSLTLPDLKEDRQGAIMNFVLGSAAKRSERKDERFTISRKDGSLEYSGIKFFPSITNRFLPAEKASLFLQVFLPQGKIEIKPNFQVSGKEGLPQEISGTLVAEFWNEKSNVWNGIFNVDLNKVIFGDYLLRVEIPLYEKAPSLTREVKFSRPEAQ